MIENKLLIIVSLLPKELRHLYGLVDKQEVNREELYNKIYSFYESKRKELLSLEVEPELLKLFKEAKKKYGNNIVIVNQEVDDSLIKHKIDSINIHGNINEYRCNECNLVSIDKNCNDCLDSNSIHNVVLKNDKGQYQQVVELLDECQSVLFIGDIAQLDPTLYLDEMISSLYINDIDQIYKGDNELVQREVPISDYFDNSIITNSIKENIEEINTFIDASMKKQIAINQKNPYRDDGIDVIHELNSYSIVLKEEHNIDLEIYDRAMIKKINKSFPFTKKLPNVYIESIWHTFCRDTNRSIKDFSYDDLFYDMLLVYSIYRWPGIKKYFTKRPKISLAQSFNNKNSKHTEIFKKLLYKKEFNLKY